MGERIDVDMLKLNLASNHTQRVKLTPEAFVLSREPGYDNGYRYITSFDPASRRFTVVKDIETREAMAEVSEAAIQAHYRMPIININQSRGRKSRRKRKGRKRRTRR